ncbi:hypothetical protein TNCV_4082411 [Trichonephila clavipes]|nr:hypothetical protein TNCV_4082411 [Trichonephila clavipes]
MENHRVEGLMHVKSVVFQYLLVVMYQLPTSSVVIHGVQCVGAGGRHPSWHGHTAGWPRQQPDLASEGILPKYHVQWIGE